MRNTLAASAALLALVGATAAQAQGSVLCAASTSAWQGVATSTDVVRMNRVIGNIPTVCGPLLRQAVARRDAVVRGLPINRPLTLAAARVTTPTPTAEHPGPPRSNPHTVIRAYQEVSTPTGGGGGGVEGAAAAAAPAPAPLLPPQAAQGLSAYARNDYTSAMSLWKEAAAAGDTDSPSWIAWLYEKGLGVSADYALARSWYEKAAALGNPEGLAGLGDLYRFGEGVQQDYAQARDWYLKAAALKDAYAENSLGELYENGLGVAGDAAAARAWFNKAAADGNADAQGWLKAHPS